MHEGTPTSMRTTCGGTSESEFLITIALQKATLSPSLFTLIMDKLTPHIQEEVPLGMLFADDLVSVDESRV